MSYGKQTIKSPIRQHNLVILKDENPTSIILILGSYLKLDPQVHDTESSRDQAQLDGVQLEME